MQRLFKLEKTPTRSAWVLKFKNKLMAKIRRVREENSAAEESLTPNELEENQKVWIKEAQKSLKDRLKRNEFRTLSPLEDEEGIIRVGGRVENALVSYETKHPALLPYDHRVSRFQRRLTEWGTRVSRRQLQRLEDVIGSSECMTW